MNHYKRSSKHHHSHKKYPNGYVEDCSRSCKLSSDPSVSKFIPVSFILSLQQNIILTGENNYVIQFNTGMIEGSGISINEQGDKITFENSGAYRFELCGDGAPFSETDIKLIFDSEGFSDEVRIFREIPVVRIENKLNLCGLSTILPINKNQSIWVKLIPDTNDSILLMKNTRLLIHRVA